MKQKKSHKAYSSSPGLSLSDHESNSRISQSDSIDLQDQQLALSSDDIHSSRSHGVESISFDSFGHSDHDRQLIDSTSDFQSVENTSKSQSSTSQSLSSVRFTIGPEALSCDVCVFFFFLLFLALAKALLLMKRLRIKGF